MAETLTRTQRANLVKLANYLESLPKDYRHFDMNFYAEHVGNCDFEVGAFPATAPQQFLSNCGAVACAVGHGPAAGVPMKKAEYEDALNGSDIDWNAYAERVFGASADHAEGLWAFMFGPVWSNNDNTPWGAAARIRYVLKHRDVPLGWGYDSSTKRLYQPYRVDERQQVHA